MYTELNIPIICAKRTFDTMIIPGPKAILTLAIAALVIVGGITCALLHLPLWLKAKACRTGLGLGQLMLMTMQGVKARAVVSAFALAAEHGLSLPLRETKAYWLSGVDIQRVTHALVEAERFGVKIRFEELAKLELTGEDLLREIQRRRSWT